MEEQVVDNKNKHKKRQQDPGGAMSWGNDWGRRAVNENDADWNTTASSSYSQKNRVATGATTASNSRAGDSFDDFEVTSEWSSDFHSTNRGGAARSSDGTDNQGDEFGFLPSTRGSQRNDYGFVPAAASASAAYASTTKAGSAAAPPGNNNNNYDEDEEDDGFNLQRTQENVMRDLQSFAEDHMSVLTGDDGMSSPHHQPASSYYDDMAAAAAANNNARAVQQQQRRLPSSGGYSPPLVTSRGSTGSGSGNGFSSGSGGGSGGTGNSDDNTAPDMVPHELLVNYMMAMGANRKTAEQLALSFSAEQDGVSSPRPAAGRRVLQPTKMRLSSKLQEAEQGHAAAARSQQQQLHTSHHYSSSDGMSGAASYSITGQQQHRQQQSITQKASGGGQSYWSPPDEVQDAYSSNQARIVEAMPVDEYFDEKGEESNLPVVYADSSPLSIKHLLNERPFRRIACVALIAVLGAVIGIVVYFTVLKEDNADGSGFLLTGSPTMTPSAAPTFISEEIKEAAAQLSGWNAVEDMTSPQFKAVSWISTFDEIDTRGLGDAFDQRYALVVMYYSFKGDDWINQEQWLDPNLHECEWSGGIFCRYDVTETRVVTGFDATRNNLRGTIPPEVGLLSSSEAFRIPKNSVAGTIPDAFGSMTSLSVADMTGNDLTGSIPTTIGGARDLILIDFSDNLLNSSIPSELFNLKLLRTLILNTNKLSGPLDASINNLEVLVTLDLRHNDLSGTFPVTVDSIATLDIIQIDYNQFTGGLPEATNSLARKQVVSLSHNKFEGNVEISAEYLLSPNITGFRIQYVDVSYNDLSGAVSPVFGFMPTLRHFDLSGNGFVGGFPSNVGWDSIEFLAAASNRLTGTIPVGYPTLTHLDMSDNDFSMGIPEELCTYPALEFLLLSDNPTGSTVPACLGSFPKIRDLELRNCQLEGTIPTSMGNLVEFEILDLSNNALTGAIPPEMGKLETMKHLMLNNNGLSGPIPTQLANMMDLRTLHLNENGLTGTFPRQLGVLVELESLLLRDNNLRGEIPSGLCGLSSLELLTKDIGCRVECPCCSDTGACDI
mmetsp:Transcript_25953/g.43288  ORF Transcript_25953/g.43288 Transcript_25953/m.43288 type:complete len:1058 (-) Transcript_25953:34-3207(-)